MNEGLALLEKLKQAESEYETARKEYLDWYFNNAPLFEQKKLKMQLLLEDCAVIILTVTALSAGFILGELYHIGGIFND